MSQIQTGDGVYNPQKPPQQKTPPRISKKAARRMASKVAGAVQEMAFASAIPSSNINQSPREEVPVAPPFEPEPVPAAAVGVRPSYLIIVGGVVAVAVVAFLFLKRGK